MNTLGNRKKIKGRTHKNTYTSAENYFRQPLLVPNNAKALYFYQIVHYISNYKKIINILEIRESFGKIKGGTYKITHMSFASYPILQKPRTNFIFLCSSFFLFSYIFMSMQIRSFLYSSLGQRAKSQL